MALTVKEIEETEFCTHCGGAFDVSLPDSDQHRYACEFEDCEEVLCYDCRGFDPDTGNNFCPDHDGSNPGRMERAHLTGAPIWVHADGRREVYYEGCKCCSNGTPKEADNGRR